MYYIFIILLIFKFEDNEEKVLTEERKQQNQETNLVMRKESLNKKLLEKTHSLFIKQTQSDQKLVRGYKI